MTIGESETVAQQRSGYSVNADFWIKIIREGLDPYRTELTDQQVIQAVRPGHGMTILDAGCGEGYLSREFARHAARVIGVDACQEFIDAAAEAAEAEHLELEHHTAQVHSIPLRASSVDVVVCNHLLTDLEELDRPLGEFWRLLGPAGRLVILMLHPCFYVSRAERSETTRSVTAEEYFTRRVIEQPFSVAGITSPAAVRQWIRPLEAYMDAIAHAGFTVTRLSEPHPTKEQIDSDPWWKDNFPRPLFLLIEATKQPVDRAAITS